MNKKQNVSFLVFMSFFLNLALFGFVGYKLYYHFVDIDQGRTIIDSPYWQDKVDFFEILNKRTKKKVFFVGDSMFDRLNIESIFKEEIANRSIGYENTTSLFERLDRSVLNANPRKIFLYIGTNDISKNNNIDDIIDHVEKIIELMMNNGSNVYFISILPRGKKYRPSNRNIVDINNDIFYLNDRIKNKCQQFACEFIDITQLFTTGEYLCSQYTSDGIHLNAGSIIRLKQVLEPYIK